VLFATWLDVLGRDAGVRAFSTHPGAILTPLQRHLRREEMVAAGWIDEDGNQVDPSFKTPEQGAATQVWAATSPRLAGMGGVYCQDCDFAEPSRRDYPVVGEHGWAANVEQAARLWTLSAELTGVDAFGTRRTR
jgi:NAD(P)-dependent dehydrogenase (short-subunit alcohol dehydrogenase family)